MPADRSTPGVMRKIGLIISPAQISHLKAWMVNFSSPDMKFSVRGIVRLALEGFVDFACEVSRRPPLIPSTVEHRFWEKYRKQHPHYPLVKGLIYGFLAGHIGMEGGPRTQEQRGET